MKKKGFTLIELLGVIIILGVLAIVAFPPLLRQINNAKMGIKDANDILIINAAKDYVLENEKEFVRDEENSYCLSIQKLIDKNYLSETLRNENNHSVDLTRSVQIKYNGKKFIYKLVNSSVCSNVDEIVSNEYTKVEDENPGIICGSSYEEDYDNQNICYIRSVEDLVEFSKLVNEGKNFSNKTVSLEYDLHFKNSLSYAITDQTKVAEMVKTLTSGNGATPIGNTSSFAFKGTFEGNNKKIGGLYMSNTTMNYIGLFGNVNNATIKDLILDAPIIRGKDYTGGLVGNNTSSSIKNIRIINGYVYGNNYVGGLVGYNNGQLSSSKFNGDVDGNDSVALAVGYNINVVSSVIVGGNVTGITSTAGIVGSNTNEVKGIYTGGTVKCINSVANRTIASGASSKTYTLGDEKITTNGSIPTSIGLNSANGYTINASMLTDINSYESAMDTKIGGDNDSDGYYIGYTGNGTIDFLPYDENTFKFTLSGSGTEQSPYLIVTSDDLIQVSLKPSAYYKLMGNIDLTNKAFYMLSSTNKNQFTGTFDGNGYTISNATFKTSTRGGIFGENQGTIKNLNIEQTSIEGMGTIGTIVGYNTGNILNVNDKNSIIKAEYDNTGMIGYINSGTVQDVRIDNLNNQNKTGKAGALTGYANTNTIIKGIEINDAVIKSNGLYVGGITGSNNGNISSAFVNNTNIEGDSYVGLAAGESNNDIKSVIVSGNVSGKKYVAGIVGNNRKKLEGLYKGGNITCDGYCKRIANFSNETVNAMAVRTTTVLNGEIINNIGNINQEQGFSTEEVFLDDINAYESVIDTRIGGDNDSDGYYLDYDEENNIKFIKTESKPVNFTLTGSGTEEDPYLITNADELYQVSLNPNSYYKLVNDIDLKDEKPYMLSSGNNIFQGTIDGNNKKISNLSLKGSLYAGLFGKISGANIYDLTIENFDIVGSSHIGGLVGFNSSSSTIKGITTLNSNAKGCQYVGALVGYNESYISSSIINGSATGDFIVKYYIGLAAGYNNGLVEDVIVSGNVSGETHSAGIIGANSNAKSTGAYINGNVIGSNRISTGTSFESIVNHNVTLNGQTIALNEITKSLNGFSVYDYILSDINAYENVIDTKIGGDNNSDGYYLDYDESNNIKFVKTVDKPINFTLSGSGTEEDPYLITTAEELYQVSLKSNNYFKLQNDIDLTGTIQYTLSSSKNVFSGVFDGNNHTISGLDIKGALSIGLFGYTSGTIKNLKINNINVEAMSNTGAFIGYKEKGTVEFIEASNVNVKGVTNTGGLIGYMKEATEILYTKKINMNNINVEATGNYTGGLIGYSAKNNYISLIKITGENSIVGKEYVGSLIGYTVSSSITNVISGGNVSGTNYIGGLIGKASGNNQIDYNGVYTHGNVNATGSNCSRVIGNISSYKSLRMLANEEILVKGKVVTSNAVASITGADAQPAQLKSINTYENVIDTYIAGDNDQDGYYLDYYNNDLEFVKTYENENILLGNGTEEDPYQIYTANDLKLATKNPTAYYKLMNNINHENENFYILGSEVNSFTGVFDGNGYTISNLKIYGNNYTGFIGYNESGLLKNISFDNIEINGKNNTGIVGYNNGTIKGINIKNEFVDGYNYVGGICGQNASKIYNVISSTTTESGSYNINGYNYIGGIVGYSSSLADSSETVFEGNISGNNYVGGIVGYQQNGTISGAYLAGEIVAIGNQVGRVRGTTSGTATINAIANSNILVNGLTKTSTSATSNVGKDTTSSELQTPSPYEAIGFNFTDTNPSSNEYIWYIENNTLKCRLN